MPKSEFKNKWYPVKVEVRDYFVLVIRKFLGSHAAKNYADFKNNMLRAYQRMPYQMSLKMHFLHSHHDFLAGSERCKR